MTVATGAVDARPDAPAGQPLEAAVRRRFRLADAAVILAYLGAAFMVLGELWLDLDRGYLINSMRDQHMWEWFFAVTAHAVSDGTSPLWSDLQNYPLGVNLMANTAMFGLGVPLAPLTLAFGPTFTYAASLTAGLAGTAAAWYWVFSRYLVRSRVAAAVGGALCGFAPAIISHANAHPNFVVLFVLPLIVLMLLRLTRGEHPVRDGVYLGLLVTLQIFIGEEPLLIAAIAMVVFAAAYAATRPAEVRAMVRPMLTGIGVGVAVTVPLVVYPLWTQFFGPQSYGLLGHGATGNDLLALTGYATESLWGSEPQPVTGAAKFAMNPTEENAYFGIPLVLLTVALAVKLWRRPVARASAIAAGVLATLSLGESIMVNGMDTGIPGPWAALTEAPLFDSVVESRFAMACVPLMAVLLAIGTDRVLGRKSAERSLLRPAWFLALAVALLPIAPTPLQVIKTQPTPAFFTEGTWRKFTDHGGSVVPVPIPDPLDATPLGWQVDAGLAFPIPEGYFVGPNGDGKHGKYGAIQRPTSTLLASVARSGITPRIDEDERAAALEDLRFWRADVVVLARHSQEDALRATVQDLLGEPGREIGDVWVWNVRPDGP